MTLPTRDDGGIDWEKIIFDSQGVEGLGFYVVGPSQFGSRLIGAVEFNKLIAAHTRERCAKCAEGVTYPYPTKESEDYRRGYHDGASDVVDIIRKMED